MNKKVIKIIIPVLIIVELCFTFLTCKSYANKEVDKVSKVNEINHNIFKMYVETDEEGVYEEFFGSTEFPGLGYKLNMEKTKCVNSMAEEVKGILGYSKGELVLRHHESVFCYLYFDLKGPDIEINVSTNGVANTIPSTLGYVKEITCENGTTPTWNYTYNRLEFTHVKSDETICNLKYTKDTKTYKTLINEVESDSEVVHETFDYGDYSSTTTIAQSGYTNTSMYSSSSWTSSSGTSTPNAFVYSGTSWSSVPENLTSDKYYNLKMYVTTPGYYELCYDIEKGHSSNSLYVMRNVTTWRINGDMYVSADPYSTESGCVEVSYLGTNNYIKVVQKAYGDSSYGIAKMNFYLKKTDKDISYDAGYRYEGANPNNYVWFNNEMWRIIGSIPTKTTSGTKNLVKLVKSDALGGGIYGAASYASSKIKTLLNSYYYGKKDATNSNYCKWGLSNYDSAICDYTVKGIGTNDVWGSMIEQVYWNAGNVNLTIDTADWAFRNEIKNQTTIGYVGLMNVSDYGYATSASHDTIMFSYDTLEHTSNNWLYGQGGEWLLNPAEDTSMKYIIGIQAMGNTHMQNNGSSAIIRPVVYLDPLVYIVSGTGTYTNPYHIAMK
ncbi:MAG: hypothetical protein IJY87_02860 [Bacilli bacterium]|nr:hypothetical protein [Bacilli bacterium]